MSPKPITLELPTGLARLEPLATAHVPDLLVAAADPDIWRYLPEFQPRTSAQMLAFVEKALATAAGGTEIPFAIIDRSSGRCIGSTRYLDIQPANRHLEIGWTWLATAAQRTSINTECKLLLLRHAFEDLSAIRVQLKTDGRNLRSQNAIMRIGAIYEGRLRQHRIMPDGFVRDTVYFSVIADEWPGVQQRLMRKLERSLEHHCT